MKTKPVIFVLTKSYLFCARNKDEEEKKKARQEYADGFMKTSIFLQMNNMRFQNFTILVQILQRK